MKKLFAVFALIASTNLLQCQTNANSATVNMAADTYGFLKGHFHALSVIKRDFPQLTSEVNDLEQDSDSLLGKAMRNIEHYLNTQIGKTSFNKLRSQIDSLLADQLSEPIKEMPNARAMLVEMRKRLSMAGPSEQNNAIIAFAFIDVPEKEFLHGYTKSFTKNSPSFSIDLPLTWHSSTAEHANALSHFTNLCGTGDARIIPMAYDNPFSRKPTRDDVRSIMNPDSKIISIKPWKNKSFDGFVLEVEETIRTADNPKKIRMLQFIFTNGPTLYCLQGSVGPEAADANLEPQLQKYEALFHKCAHSVKIAR